MSSKMWCGYCEQERRIAWRDRLTKGSNAYLCPVCGEVIVPLKRRHELAPEPEPVHTQSQDA